MLGCSYEMMSAAAVIIGRQGMWICVAAKTGDTETIVIVVKKWHAGDVDLCQCKRKRHLNE